MNKKPLIKYLSDEQHTLAFGAELAKACGDTAVIFLRGNLGAGKTTLTRGFLRGLGFEGKVKSPTYTLVEPYQIGEQWIYHFDLYRLHSAEELLDIGVHDYFTGTAICLIEWPEKGQGFLPEPDLLCEISFVEDGRRIKIEARSEIGKKIITKLEE